jgi:hypothetical protein
MRGGPTGIKVFGRPYWSGRTGRSSSGSCSDHPCDARYAAPDNVRRETYYVFCRRSEGGSCRDGVLRLNQPPAASKGAWAGVRAKIVRVEIKSEKLKTFNCQGAICPFSSESLFPSYCWLLYLARRNRLSVRQSRRIPLPFACVCRTGGKLFPRGRGTHSHPIRSLWRFVRTGNRSSFQRLGGRFP